MKFSLTDKQRIAKFYNDLLAQNGPNEPRSLSWRDKQSQQLRMDVLSQIIDLNNKSILDVGCGFGDLYDYLKDRYQNFTYTGIDIVHENIEVAKQKYPNIEFIEADFNSYNGEKFDVVLASGALSFKVPDYKKVYFALISKMFETAKLAVGFNMLDAELHSNDELFASYSLAEVNEFCASLTNKIKISQDYLPYDFTMFLYH